MVSVESVVENLAYEMGRILILMQEGDTPNGFSNVEWADEMYDAYEHVKKATQCIHRAIQLDS